MLSLARRFSKAACERKRWSALAAGLGFQYLDKPSRLMGDWSARLVYVEARAKGVRVTTRLSRASRLRVEFAQRDALSKHSAPSRLPLACGDPAFDARLLAFCDDREAAASLLAPSLRARLLREAAVDVLGSGQTVRWDLPDLGKPDALGRTLDALAQIAAAMERFPAHA
ncbi:MAG: hypothetical protein KGO96_04665 [Elusimicrobia bacterium]|nr:hypothetical protein [Elusimicrobiota bacterium]MDE2236417.1 hypothetical protein [Elusimicrobiota bacterium]MDE2425183.1 hypothetical protein [Elusimicrobiota bacterium]